jgi:hypothetical protein
MPKTLLLLVLLCCTKGFGQNIVLKGTVTNTKDEPLESATIYISNVKDSLVVEYTVSDKNGNWQLKTPKLSQPFFLKISYLGSNDYKEQIAALDKDRNFGTIKLAEKSTELNEIVIESETPPIRIKKDTLEFNAASFKVRPDANVQTLIKRLPGVTIDSENKIFFNGKEVNQILVNGKPFFDADGKIALQNLPADIIDKVQVSDTKTKQEELSGQKATGDNASINLTIKKEKNKGLFGRITAGYGSNKRYETSGLLNYFKENRRISLLASSNNINSSGFSSSEMFDSMGGNRMMMRAGMGSVSAPGITISSTMGLNYGDQFFKDLNSNLSYNYTGNNSENRTRTEATNYLPVGNDADNPGTTIDKSYTTNSISNSTSETLSHNFNGDLTFKIDSTATINYRPRLIQSNSTGNASSQQNSTRLTDSRLLNESNTNTYSSGDDNTFTSQLNYYKRFRSKKGRGISLNFSNNNQDNNHKNLNKSNTIRYSYPGTTTQTATDSRNQVLYNNNSTDTYMAGFDYSEPVTDSLKITVRAKYNFNKNVENRDSYNFDEALGTYSVYNDSLSNYLESQTATLTPKAGLSLNKKKLNVTVEVGANATTFKNFSNYLSQPYTFKRNYTLPTANANFNYAINKGKYFNGAYTYTSSFPSASQVLPIADISNPLHTFTGNPDLNPTRTHSVRVNFRNFGMAKRKGFNIYASANFYSNQVVAFTVTDESAKSITTYRNISGAMSSSAGTSWNKTYKKDAHNFSLNMSLTANYSTNKGYLNAQVYNSKSVGISPNASLAYDYGELLSINPSYSFNYNEYSYSNYSAKGASSFVHSLNLQTTSYWPKHVIFGNDIGFTYNSNIADGFKKSFYLWNTSIGYNFLNEELMFKVKVYDVLNQNNGTKRTVGPTTVTDVENIVLRRYIMFSLTYKLQQFGGEKHRVRTGL